MEKSRSKNCETNNEMNRKNFLKTIGMGSLVLAANPVKLVAESKMVNDVSIKILLTRGGSIEISNNSSYSGYPDDSNVVEIFVGIGYTPSGSSSNDIMSLMRDLIDLKDVLVESSYPLKSYNEFDCSNIFDNIGNDRCADSVKISINNENMVGMFSDDDGRSLCCYYCPMSKYAVIAN